MLFYNRNVDDVKCLSLLQIVVVRWVGQRKSSLWVIHDACNNDDDPTPIDARGTGMSLYEIP